jgi:DNA-binding response OmpR family regulator
MIRLLIIEDDNFLMDIYTHVFRKYGYEVEQAYNGQEGIDKANSGKYNLILLDILLPKKNGLEVVQELRLDSSPAKSTPIILLSNLGREDTIREGYARGANGYLLKADLLPKEVVQKVEDFLGGKLTRDDFLPSKSST